GTAERASPLPRVARASFRGWRATGMPRVARASFGAADNCCSSLRSSSSFVVVNELEKLRHSAAHLMADSVKRVWQEAKLIIGPRIETGFYYDFDIDHHFTDEDLVRLERIMGEIVDADLPFEEREITREQAIEYFARRNEPYKVELAQAIPEGERI